MSNPIYTDSVCSVQMSEQPLCIGHLLVVPHNAVYLEKMSHKEVSHLFTVASYCTTLLFEGLKAQGTNIIASNGTNSELSQPYADRVCLHVIPRSAEDGLGLLWQMEKGDPEKVAEAGKKIADAMFFGDEKEPEKIVLPQAKVVEQTKKPKEDSAKKTEFDLRIEHLKRRFY